MTLPGTALLAPFGIAGFTGLWVSASAASLARMTIQLAFGWLALEATDSPFVVGVVAAARMAPQLVFGIPAGAIADFVDRRKLLIVVNALGALLLLGVVGVAMMGLLTLPVMLVAVALIGVLDPLRTAATQAYAYDLVRGARATNGMALTNLGVLLGMVGGIVGGWTLERFGAPTTFGLIALALLVAALAPLFGSPGALPGAGPYAIPTQHARPEFRRAATMLLRSPFLAVLALAIVLAEILGFATQTLLPMFARDVFHVGAAGLGTMTGLRSLGGALSLVLLAAFGTGGRSGLAFLAGCVTFGLTLVVFSVTPAYALALVLLVVSGGAASAIDTLGQTLLQRNADERERGAAMGVWVCAVGFGPIGHLTLGASAEAFGVARTQFVSGTLLALVGAFLTLHSPFRRAR